MEQEHTKAAETHAVERYALGEMTEDERLAFEDHYFDCRICAAEVTYAMQMMSAGQVVAREDQSKKVVPMPSRSRRWFPQAAAAALILSVVGNGMQFARMQQLQAPTVLESVWLTDLVRDEGKPSVKQIPAGRRALLGFDIDSKEVPDHYLCEIRDQDGKLRDAVKVTVERAAEPVSLLTGELPAGRYELVIRGVRKDGNRFEVTRYQILAVGERKQGVQQHAP